MLFNRLFSDRRKPPDPAYLYSWGNNDVGQLGLGDTSPKSSPNQIGSDYWNVDGTNFQKVDAAVLYTAGIKRDGTLWTWGINTYGQLGLGDTVERSSPTQVGLFNDWIHISCGNNFMTAIRSDGTLWAWGYNGNGELGDGTVVDKSSPIQIGASSWTQISSGGNHTLAIKLGGTLWAWGANGNGQLGDGTDTDRSSPIQIGASSWTQISAGAYSSMAIKVNNDLWGWGSNSQGELGLGDTIDRFSPVQIPGLWKKVDISKSSSNIYNHTLAIDSNDYLYAWGNNDYGQIGDGQNLVAYSSPVQIGSNSWITVCAIEYGSYAIRTNKTLWAWGRNIDGQLGNSTTTEESSPIQVGAQTDWRTITGGWYHAIGTRDA